MPVALSVTASPCHLSQRARQGALVGAPLRSRGAGAACPRLRGCECEVGFFTLVIIRVLIPSVSRPADTSPCPKGLASRRAASGGNGGSLPPAKSGISPPPSSEGGWARCVYNSTFGARVGGYVTICTQNGIIGAQDGKSALAFDKSAGRAV